MTNIYIFQKNKIIIIKEIDTVLTPKELEEIELEKEIIRATIKAIKDSKLTQQELSEK